LRRRPTGQGTARSANPNNERNTVERCINKIKAWRGLAMRSDKRPDSYLAGLQLRGSMIRLCSLKPDT
jgi:transposase